MSRYRVVPGLALLLVLSAQTAHAFFDPPYITPAAPAAGEMVTVNIRGGICDSIVGTPGYPQITQNGNVIRFLVFGVRTEDIDYCNYPVGTATFPVGAYPAGSYTLQFDLLYDDYPFGLTIAILGVVPFTVTGAPASVVPAPTNSPLALLALSLALVGLAVGVLRERRYGFDSQ